MLLLSEIYDLAEEVRLGIGIFVFTRTALLLTIHQIGKLTPEGLHLRWSLNYIASLMINKINVAGGETAITDNNGELLEALTLEKTFDLVLANDDQTMHQVSPISPQSMGKCAYRDVLVIAFTKMEN